MGLVRFITLRKELLGQSSFHVFAFEFEMHVFLHLKILHNTFAQFSWFLAWQGYFPCGHTYNVSSFLSSSP